MKKYKFTYENSGVNINAADNFVKYIANLESKKNVIEKFRKSKIAKEFERSFPDAKLIDIEEQ